MSTLNCDRTEKTFQLDVLFYIDLRSDLFECCEQIYVYFNILDIDEK